MRLLYVGLIGLACLLLNTSIYAQKKAKLPKVGKPDASWFSDNPHASDSSVHAYVIADISQQTFEINRVGTTRSTHRTIIKVVDEQGKDIATVRIPLYNSSRGTLRQTLGRLKAYTYNKTKGDVQRSEVDNDQIFTTRVTPFYQEASFSFPDVRAGSVLDLEYEVVANDYYLEDVPLQRSIPVERVEHTTRVYEAFDVAPTQVGYALVEQTQERRPSRNPNLDGQDIHHIFKGTKLPAAKPEPYITSLDNYKSQVLFELRSFFLPGQTLQQFSGSWDLVATNLTDYDQLRNTLNGQPIYKKIAEELPSDITDPGAKAAWALNQVQRRVRWNEVNSIYPLKTNRQILSDAEGSAADANLVLLGVWSSLGLEAAPVFISTRQHGRVVDFLPRRSAFNRMIAAVNLGEQWQLADATDPLGEIGVLPDADLNGFGLLVLPNSNRHKLIDTQEGLVKQRALQAQLTLTEDDYLEGDVTLRLNPVAAKSYVEVKSGKRTFDFEESLLAGYTIKNQEVKRDNKGTYIVTAQIRSKTPVIDLGDAKAFVPIVATYQSENPFVREERIYPVEFPTRMVDSREVVITLPEGMHVEELPEPMAAMSEDRKTQYRYALKEENGKLTLSSLFVSKKLIHLPAEYKGLKGLFDLAIESDGQLVSIK